MIGEVDDYYAKAKSRSQAYYAAGSEFSFLLIKEEKATLVTTLDKALAPWKRDNTIGGRHTPRPTDCRI